MRRSAPSALKTTKKETSILRKCIALLHRTSTCNYLHFLISRVQLNADVILKNKRSGIFSTFIKMSSSENNTITLLNDITDNINRYFTMCILLFDCIGNILNIFVLSQRNLRTNPCGWFFLISSIFNLLSIVFGVSTRLLSGWNIDPTKTVHWFCKLRTYIVFSSRSNAFWLIMFATIDRWLSSCSNVHY